jgi:hypothetical protein
MRICRGRGRVTKGQRTCGKENAAAPERYGFAHPYNPCFVCRVRKRGGESGTGGLLLVDGQPLAGLGGASAETVTCGTQPGPQAGYSRRRNWGDQTV